MTSDIYIGDENPPKELPFAPVYEAMRDVMTKGEKPLTFGQIMDGVVSLVVTATLNIHVSLRDADPDNPEVPSPKSIAQSFCFHIMRATAEAEEGARQRIGLGVTKQ